MSDTSPAKLKKPDAALHDTVVEARPAGEEEEGGHAFWPSHVINQTIIFYLVMGGLVSLSVLVPFHLHAQADPFDTPEGIKPEWYFLAAYQLLKYIPKAPGVCLLGITVLLLVFWPFVDNLVPRRFGKYAYRLVGILGLAGFLFLTFLGWVCERTVTLGSRAYEIDLLGVPRAVQPEDSGARAPGSPAQDSPEGEDAHDR